MYAVKAFWLSSSIRMFCWWCSGKLSLAAIASRFWAPLFFREYVFYERGGVKYILPNKGHKFTL